jgi:hypothetical protein
MRDLYKGGLSGFIADGFHDRPGLGKTVGHQDLDLGPLEIDFDGLKALVMRTASKSSGAKGALVSTS